MKILIIEDDLNVSNLLVMSLEKWNFDVVCASDFANLVDDVITSEADLILLDVNLPYLDGFSWCLKFREVTQVPILFLSSRDSSMDQIMAMNMGGDDYITKPFSEDVLVAKIKAHLRRSLEYSQSNNNVINVDSVCLDVENSSITYFENSVNLTSTEHKIMIILMKNNHKVVSREQIITSLWDDMNFISDNTLTVNIRRIRAKLSSIGVNDFINTIKNAGYIIK